MKKLHVLPISFFALILIFSCSNNKEKALELYLKGKEKFDKKELDNARLHFSKAIDTDSSLLNAKLMLAKVDFYQKKFKKALSHISDILDKDPDHSGALYWKARILTLSGAKEEADKNQKESINCLAKVLEIDAYHIRARLLLALLYEKEKNYKKAIYHYKVLINEQETIINARANIGILYKKLGLQDKAKQELQIAREIAKISNLPENKIEIILKEIEK